MKTGQEVKVKVLSVDPDRDRISLSIKQTLPEPWDGIEEKAPEGAVLEGTVKRLTSFGAFVEVFPGVEGLVHISQIAHEHIATPNDVLSTGEKVNVKVLEVHPEAHRLALSIKALKEKPASSEPEKKQSAPRRQNNNNSNNNRQNVVSTDDDDAGFTLGDLIGDQLKNAQNSDSDSDKD